MSDNVLYRLLLVLTVFSVAGCSVKEQRDDCPCRLVLDFSETDTGRMDEMRVVITENDETVYERYSDVEDFLPEHVISVSKNDISLFVCSDDRDCFEADNGIVIPQGQDCPRLHMYCREVNARVETFRDTVQMSRNHCVMTIYMENLSSSEYELCVKGNVNGYGLDGRPRKGNFSFSPARDEDSGYVVSLPRQLDSSLLLEIDDGTEVLKTFALGEYIKAGGYDWTASDLEDFTVHVNWAVTKVSLTVSGWDWVYECEIVI